MKPFAPHFGSTVSLGADTASDSVALSSPPGGEFQVRIHNAGDVLAFVDFGTSDVTASAATDVPIPSGAVEVLTIINPSSMPTTHVAVVTATGTATVYFTIGEGI